MNRCSRLLPLFVALVLPSAYEWLSITSCAADNDELFWSFQPVRVMPPVTKPTTWTQSAIDQYVLAKLTENGLTPSARADKRTLIRRVTFDLTGLPPTPEEVADYLADSSPDSFARLVDRLLASPHYGERWGRHWLDVVRYADARDLIQLPAESDFREAWRYRDWVVNAFNRDLSYNDFVRHQIAGDLLQPADPAAIDADALVATGMLAIADFVPGDVDKQQMIADYVNDQIDVVGRAFLGLTLACARCHDHKFDPISTEDYYSLAGIFFSTRLVPGPVKGNTPLIRVPLLAPPVIAAREAEQARDKARLAELDLKVSTFADREYRDYLERRVAQDASRYLLAAWDYVHAQTNPQKPLPADFARSRSLEERTFLLWIRYFEEPRPHPAIAYVRRAPDLAAQKERLRELAESLSRIAGNPRDGESNDSMASTIAANELYRFRGDDRRIQSNSEGKVTNWPNRGRVTANAIPVQDAMTPMISTVDRQGIQRDLLRFTGKDLLQVSGSVPSQGSLLVLFRLDPNGSAGQRLIGWEDSSVGQHGLGVMTDAAGNLHAILRRNGASGDVTVPALADAASMGFQLLTVTWGPAGVAVFRNGQPVGMNKGIDSVSSDPAITSLRIGGPGSGASARFQGDIAELRVFSAQFDDAQRLRIESEITAHWKGALEDEPMGSGARDLYEELVSPLGPFQWDVAEREKSLPGQSRQRLAQLQSELDSLKKKPALAEIPRAVVVQDGGPPGTPHEGFRDAAIYLRGDHLKPGRIVPRGVPKVVAGAEPFVIATGSGRKELARWLTDPANPLTARVMTNRIWQHHFGAGLVRSSTNFGVMGEQPSHPELLDYLAARFISSGWSIKAMHRLVLLSSTYQQASVAGTDVNDDDCRRLQKGLAVDPENRWLWRANRRRLEAEGVRDSLLAIALRLDDIPGGPGYQEVTTPRRSLYLMSVRTGGKTAEFGPLFDAADCTGIIERRMESIVAPQALFLMNDPWILELATALAQRTTGSAAITAPTERINRLYEIALGRPALQAEQDVGLKFLADVKGQGLTDEAAWNRYCHLIICTNEFLYVD